MAGSNQLLDFLKSNGGSSLIQAIMGGIGSVGDSNQQNKMNQQQLAQNAALMQQNFGQNMMDDKWNRDQAVVQASPLGWAQGYQQQQLGKNIALQKLLSGSGLTPTGDGVKAILDKQGYQSFKPTIPEEWQSVNPFGVGQTMEALQNRQQGITQLGGGNAPQIDFSQFGIDPAMAQRLNSGNQQFQQQQQGLTDANTNRLQEAVNMSRNAAAQQAQQQQKSGGIMSKIGGVLKAAAPFASFIPGVGTLAGLGLSAAGGALGSAMQGGGVMGGAATGALGGALAQKFSQPQGQPMTMGNGGLQVPQMFPQQPLQNPFGPKQPQRQNFNLGYRQ